MKRTIEDFIALLTDKSGLITKEYIKKPSNTLQTIPASDLVLQSRSLDPKRQILFWAQTPENWLHVGTYSVRSARFSLQTLSSNWSFQGESSMDFLHRFKLIIQQMAEQVWTLLMVPPKSPTRKRSKASSPSPSPSIPKQTFVSPFPSIDSSSWKEILKDKSEDQWDGALLTSLIQRSDFFMDILNSEYLFIKWKRHRYEAMVAELKQLLESTIQDYQAFEKYTKEAFSSSKPHKISLSEEREKKIAYLLQRKASLQEILRLIDERLTRLREGRSVSSSLIQHKQQQLQECIQEIETLKGQSRQELRLKLYKRIVTFALSSSLFHDSFSNNMIFMGGPGIGKSSAAKVVAQVFSKLGLLIKSVVWNSKKHEFIGPYIGQTAPLTRSTLESALESVLLIDEAYSISGCSSRSNTKSRSELSSSVPAPVPQADYGPEAMTEMVDFASEHAGLISIIAAGYEFEMKHCFLAANEGLPRRFPEQIVLKTYQPEDLIDILLATIRKRIQTESHQDDENNNPEASISQTSIQEQVFQSLLKLRPYMIQTVQAIMKQDPQAFPNQAGDMVNLSDKLLETAFLDVGLQGALSSSKMIRLIEDYNQTLVPHSSA